MTDSIVYVDRSSVRDGSLDELRDAMADLVAFVDEHEPDILEYNVYFDDAGEQMTVVHAHTDQSSLEHHMDVAGPKFPPIGEFIDMESIDVYGRLSDELAQQLREKAATLGSGRVTIHEFHAGIDRLGGG